MFESRRAHFALLVKWISRISPTDEISVRLRGRAHTRVHGTVRYMGYKDPELQRMYQLHWMLARRMKWISANGPCKKCGSDVKLEVDHVNPKTKFTHRIWSFNKVRRTKELKKCQVLCYSCHKMKTSDSRRTHLRHGSYAMYKVLKCRCVLCKSANAKAARIYRATGRYPVASKLII